MGWEKRGARLIYYRKARGADGRVRSIYCGSGERGREAEREDVERRASKRAARVAHGNNSRKHETSSPVPAGDAATPAPGQGEASPPCATNGAHAPETAAGSCRQYRTTSDSIPAGGKWRLG
jgi:hypothetical protein